MQIVLLFLKGILAGISPKLWKYLSYAALVIAVLTLAKCGYQEFESYRIRKNNDTVNVLQNINKGVVDTNETLIENQKQNEQLVEEVNVQKQETKVEIAKIEDKKEKALAKQEAKRTQAIIKIKKKAEGKPASVNVEKEIAKVEQEDAETVSAIQLASLWDTYCTSTNQSNVLGQCK